MSSSLVRAQILITYLRDQGVKIPETVPRRMILSFLPAAVKEISRKSDVQHVRFLGSHLNIFSEFQCGVLSGFGMGAPSLAAKLEELYALGAREFILHGIAGALTDLKIGSQHWIRSALIDERVSPLYGAGDKESFASYPWMEQLGVSPQEGLCSWSTSAPYRETSERCEYFRKQGASLVDMEASALFSVGAHLGASTAAYVGVSDQLGKIWEPHFMSARVKDSSRESLEHLLLKMKMLPAPHYD